MPKQVKILAALLILSGQAFAADMLPVEKPVVLKRIPAEKGDVLPGTVLDILLLPRAEESALMVVGQISRDVYDSFGNLVIPAGNSRVIGERLPDRNGHVQISWKKLQVEGTTYILPKGICAIEPGTGPCGIREIAVAARTQAITNEPFRLPVP